MKKILFGILIVAIFLRIYQPCFLNLNSCLQEDSVNAHIVPPSLNWDEISLGYNAYSILKTGKDEWGKFLPISFEAFGDYKLPGYIYTDVPFISIFGLNAFSVRLPSMISGILSVLLLYLIVKKLLKDNFIATFTAFLFAISPWNIFLSRAALEANLAFAFFLLGFYIFLISLEKPRLALIPVLFFGLSIFTYNSARIFVPLFLILLVIIYRKKILENKKSFIVPAIITAIILGVGAYFALFQDSSSRYFWVAIVDQGAINYLDQSRGSSHLIPILTDLIYNRYTYFFVRFLVNYFSHFSPQFLFLDGGSNYQFSMPGFGLLYIIEIPFIVLGLISLKKYKKESMIILGWLLIAPLPSAITREAPHALRAIFMLGSLQIISALGIYEITLYFKNKQLRYAILCLICVLFLIGLLNYYTYYLNSYPKKYSQAWQYGYKEAYQMLGKILSNNSQIKKVYVSKIYGEPHIFYLFYNLYDPTKYQTNPTLIRYSRSDWRWVDRLDNIYFVNDWEVKNELVGVKNAILITSPSNYPDNFSPIDQVKFLDNSVAFDIAQSR